MQPPVSGSRDDHGGLPVLHALKQRARIQRAASLFVAGKPSLAGKGMRFDIVTVAPLPRHIRDAWRP